MSRRGRTPRRAPGEFDLIRAFTAGAPRAGAGVLLGIGDDCALLAPPRGEALAVTVDAVVDGVHFGPSFAPEDVGWKALAVNLSDLAAMGARPLWALCALAVPRGADPAALARVGRGLAACARRHGVALAGGNVTSGPALSLTVTAVGAVPARRALTRAGARPGDLVAVSGALGDAALGLEPGAPAACLRRQRRPAPRVALGLALRGVARAAIDLSDGLLQDLGHVCAASRVGAEVEVGRLPTSAAFRRATRGRPGAADLALAGGEDYELCLAIPPSRWARALAVARALRIPLRAVGRFTASRRPDVVLVGPEGVLPPPARRGHDHLRLR